MVWGVYSINQNNICKATVVAATVVVTIVAVCCRMLLLFYAVCYCLLHWCLLSLRCRVVVGCAVVLLFVALLYCCCLLLVVQLSRAWVFYVCVMWCICEYKKDTERQILLLLLLLVCVSVVSFELALV